MKISLNDFAVGVRGLKIRKATVDDIQLLIKLRID